MGSVGKGWKKCGKELCGETREKMWKIITWEKCENFVKRIVWEKCGKEYCEKSGKYLENNNMGKLWENCEKIVWKRIAWESVENNNI